METDICTEIKQTKPFTCLEQEAHISLGRTWAMLDHALSEALKPYNITPTQYNVLRILRGAGSEGLCRHEVMSRMIAAVPDATRLLDRLEALGLIRRERSTSDRRYVTTQITDEGLALVNTLDDPIEQIHRQQFRGFGEARLRQLIELLAQLRSNG
jgi:DNA-binding MarR family transcriptional regulator